MASISFSGMSSGLDTDSIVEALCATAANKVTKSEQQEQMMQIKQGVWKELNSKIYSFYTSLDKVRLIGNFSTTKTTSSATQVATVPSTSALSDGNHSFEVKTLATKANVSTQKIKYKVSDGNDYQTATKETTLKDIFEVDKNESNSVKDVEITISGTDLKDEKIILEDDMTIAQLEEKLGTALKDKGYEVKFNSSLGTFGISSKETGKQSLSLSVSNNLNEGKTDEINILNRLGFATDSGVPKKTTATGTNLVGVFDGMNIDQTSNVFQVEGKSSDSPVEITATGVGTTTLTSAKNTEGVYDMIKGFVDSYNSLMDEISKLVDAESTSLSPLTDEEKEDMTESEIKEHEEALKAAALRNDSTLRTLRTDLRKIISEAAIKEDSGKVLMSFSSIGIKSSTNWKDNGKLSVDEDKLKKAIETDSDTVSKLFAKQVTSTSTDKQEGVITKLYNTLKNNFKGNTQKSTNTIYNDKVLTKNLKSQQSETKKLEERLETLKELYYSKFIAMETMLSTINAQSATISSYFSS